MQGEYQIYHLKVDKSGRIVLQADVRSRHHIAEGDTVLVDEDRPGMRIKTRSDALADARAYFAKLAFAGVLLSEEVLNDRRSEAEPD